VPDNGEGRAPRQRPGPAPTTTATNGPAMVPGRGDPTAVGELLAAWIGAKLAEVDDLVAEAHSRVEAIPDQRVLWSLVGEVIVLLRSLELEVAELRKAARR
jgi:hypothetical protein